MANEAYEDIGDELRRITHTDKGDRFPLMSGVVKGYNEGEQTITVRLTTDAAETPTEGILLNVLTGNGLGLLCVPAIGADCEVAELDGDGKLTLIRCSKLEKLLVTIGGTTFTVINGKVKAEDGAGAVLEMSGGMFKLSNATGSLGAMIDGLMDDLIGAAVTTGGGPGTFDPTTIGKLTADKTKLASILK